MSAVAVAPANQWQGAPAATTAGLGAYLKFIWRRNWVRGLVWFLVIVGMVGYIANFYKGQFTTSADLKGFADLAQAPSLAAMVGVIDNPATLGGAIWCKGFMFLSLMLGIGMVYLVTRNLRGDEDTGRLELMRSYPLGLHSPLAASVVLAAIVSVASGVFSALALNAVGVGTVSYAASPPSQAYPNGVPAIAAVGNTGAWAFGISIAAMGLLGIGIAAVTNQLASSDGAANGIGIGVFAVFYIIRMIGDLVGARALLWISPIGWGELVDPWASNRVLPIILSVVLAIVLIVIGWMLEAKRDMSAGIIEVQPSPARAAQLALQASDGDAVAGAPLAGQGPARASKLLQNVAGLGLRTQRSSIIVWCVAVVLFGALLGSVINKIPDLFSNMPLASGGTNAMVSMIMCLVALAIAVFAVQSSSTLRSDEERGVLESQLAGGVSRLGWAIQRLAVTVVAVVVMLVLIGAVMGASWASAVGDQTRLGYCVGAMLQQLPAILILIGITMLGFGWWPKVATPVVWAVIGVFWAILLIGVALHIPTWMMNALPFVPGQPMTVLKDVMFLVIAIVFIVVGLIGFRRRDVPVM